MQKMTMLVVAAGIRLLWVGDYLYIFATPQQKRVRASYVFKVIPRGIPKTRAVVPSSINLLLHEVQLLMTLRVSLSVTILCTSKIPTEFLFQKISCLKSM